MMPLTVGSLFSGIGGFELGLERTGGFKTAWQCEINPFCLKVLEKHWPGVKRFADIKKMGIGEEIPYVDVICGGFPCQPVSCAGKRKGKEDTRWLWPEFCRVVRCVRPEWVLIENVPGLLSADAGRLFAGILRDLSESGYDAEWTCLRASDAGAPHRRERIFVMAHTDGWNVETHGKTGTSGQIHIAGENQLAACRKNVNVTNPVLNRLENLKQTGTTSGPIDRNADWWSVEPNVGRVAHGIPSRVDRLRALGNAIVPQCAQFVGQCLLDSIRTEAAQ